MEELDSGNTRLIRTELNRICTETYVEMIAGRIVVVGQIFALIVARFVADVVAQPPAAVAAAAVVVAVVADVIYWLTPLPPTPAFLGWWVNG